jgi:hypothetical protein
MAIIHLFKRELLFLYKHFNTKSADYYSQIYFIPYLFYFYFYYFIFSLVILRFTLLFIIRLFGLLPFPVIAAFHTIFSRYSHPAPRAALGHTET